MKMVSRGVGDFDKLRIMISGIAYTGKTWSIASFEEEGKSLVVIVCPGEGGIRSLPDDNENFKSYYVETDDDDADMRTVEWSRDAMDVFYSTYKEVVKNKPDKLFIDGIHHLYAHTFNVVSNGEFLSGVDMNLNADGKYIEYRSANLYGRGHRTFNNWLNIFYTCPVPFVGVTVWEELQDEKDESQKPAGFQKTKYYHPALPGRMAVNVSGRFDARVSARKLPVCIHTKCELTKEYQEHYVWQFVSTGDVQGVGIKGLALTPAMMKTPWIHQEWSALKNLLKRV